MVTDYSYQGRRHIKRDYYNKTFKNPYFNKETPLGKKFNTKLYIQVLTVLFLIYVIIYSDLFKVQNIEIVGNDLIPAEEIKSIAEQEVYRWKLLLFPGRNLIFVNSKKIEKKLSEKYSFEELKINKGWQKLIINIKEKPANIIINNSKNYFFIDASGVVIKELTVEETNNYLNKFPMVELNQDLTIGASIVSSRVVNYILELDNNLKNSKYKVKKYSINEVDQIIVYMEGEWRAFFSVNTSISASLDNLRVVLDQRIKGKKFEYVDLRLMDRVIYFPE